MDVNKLIQAGNICIVFALLFAAISVVLFFMLHIPRIVGELTGRYARKTMRQRRESRGKRSEILPEEMVEEAAETWIKTEVDETRTEAAETEETETCVESAETAGIEICAGIAETEDADTITEAETQTMWEQER